MQERLPSVDGLRGISILLVLVSHSVLSTNFPQSLRFLAGLGKLGVGVFFVISGFLITTLLMREKERTGQISLRNFYVRRVLRIFPVAYLYIAVVAFLSFRGLVQLSPHDLAFALSYLMNYHHNCAWIFGHFWSLTAEEQFYLVWPLLVVILGLRRSMIVALAYILIAPISRILPVWLIPWRSVISLLPNGSSAIATGSVLALIWKWMQARKTLFGSRFFSLFLLLAVALQLYLLRLHSRFHVPGILISVLIGIWIFRCIEIPDDLVGKLLNSVILSSLGTLSYSIYVWHEMFFLYSPTSKSVIPWNLIATLGVAVISYNFVERPFLRLKNRLIQARSDTTEARIAPAPTESLA